MAAAGCVVGIAAFTLGFSARRRHTYHFLLIIFLGIVVTWAIWVLIRPV
jgi:hypothetical protein